MEKRRAIFAMRRVVLCFAIELRPVIGTWAGDLRPRIGGDLRVRT